MDLAFILDSSGSVGSYNFQQVKNFVKDVVDFFTIGTSGTQVAVVTHSTYTRLEFNLKAHYTIKFFSCAATKLPTNHVSLFRKSDSLILLKEMQNSY